MSSTRHCGNKWHRKRCHRFLWIALMAMILGSAYEQAPAQCLEQQKLTALDAGELDEFGSSVSVSGDTAVVGARFDTCAAGDDCGSAYVFRFNGISWDQEQKLSASDAAADDEFGGSVSVSGDTIVVGAYEDECAAGFQCGSAYVFRFNGSSWDQEQKLTASDADVRDFFGKSVSVSGDTVLVGAFAEDCPGGTVFDEDCGAVYAYRFNGTAWVEEQKLTASDARGGDEFGHSVSVNGEAALVGAPSGGGVECPNCGAAYVFRFNGSSWVEQQTLTASDADRDGFGGTVSVSGDVALVGAPVDNCFAGLVIDCGSAYVFRFNGATWDQEQKLTASDMAVSDRFGWSVTVSGNTAVIGTYRDNCAAGDDCGSAYVFRFNGTSWVERQRLTASDAGADDELGISVSVSGETAVVGAHFDDCTAGDDCGSAYVFDLDEPCCGNGNLDAGEECDDMDDAACPGACLSDCTCGPFCGDGICDPDESSCACSLDCDLPAPPTIHVLPDNFGVLKENRKGRMLAVVMEGIPQRVAIEVEFVDLPDPYDSWNGARLWARDPVELCDLSVFCGCDCTQFASTYFASLLSCNEPVYRDWSEAGIVNLWHEGVIPGATYRVRVVEEGCPLLEANFSQPLEMTTAIFGDVVGIPGSVPPEPVDDSVDVSDALAGIAAFGNVPGRPSKTRTDLTSRCISHSSDIDDVLSSLLGFAGLGYPETPSGADPCTSPCTSPPSLRR